MSDQQPGYRPNPMQGSRQQPIQGTVAWSQVTNFLNNQSLAFVFMLIIAALFIAYNLAEREGKNAHTSRPRTVPPEPQQSE